MDFTVSEKTNLAKFDIGESYMYAEIDWKCKDNIIFQIKIFDDVSSWSGCFSNNSAEQCRKDVRETKDEYYKNIYNIFITDHRKKYTYKFIDETDDARFEWWKTFTSTNVKLVHGFVFLKKDPLPKNKHALIDLLFNKNQLLKIALEESNETIKSLKLENEDLKAELTNLVDVKTALEDSLYGKFVTIINTKKRRIQELEDYIETYVKS